MASCLSIIAFWLSLMASCLSIIAFWLSPMASCLSRMASCLLSICLKKSLLSLDMASTLAPTFSTLAPTLSIAATTSSSRSRVLSPSSTTASLMPCPTSCVVHDMIRPTMPITIKATPSVTSCGFLRLLMWIRTNPNPIRKMYRNDWRRITKLRTRTCGRPPSGLSSLGPALPPPCRSWSLPSTGQRRCPAI